MTPSAPGTRHPEWERVAAGPSEANVASVRALEKPGFRRVATLADPEGPCPPRCAVPRLR